MDKLGEKKVVKPCFTTHSDLTNASLRTYQWKRYGAEAFAAFVNNLFSSLSLFKIYLEVYEYNQESLLASGLMCAPQCTT